MPKVDYKTFEPGTYEVVGLEFFTKDNDGLPVFVVQETKRGPHLTARYRTVDAAGDEMPPGSVRPEELALLVYAFGGDPLQLPADKTRALEVAERLINESDKVVRVGVGEKSGGWIKWVNGARLPAGEYLFKMTGFQSVGEDGKPVWWAGQYGENAKIGLEVVQYADGAPCPFAGSLVSLYINRQAFAILRVVVPTIVDAILGEPDNELPLLADAISQATHLIYGAMEENDKGRPVLMKDSLRVVKPGDVVETKEIHVDHEATEPDFMASLYQAIKDACSDAFDASGNLTDAGKTWCRARLGPIAQEHSLTNRFADMTREVVETYLRGLGREDLISGSDSDDNSGDGW